ICWKYADYSCLLSRGSSASPRTKREVNKYADRLARMGQLFGTNMVIFDQPPFEMVSIFEQDGAGNQK
ncbi:hypothetical protein Golax_002097, partial [Gossypium laxum]|nr:hypothetical protein [Gossypium laxum]